MFFHYFPIVEKLLDVVFKLCLDFVKKILPLLNVGPDCNSELVFEVLDL